MKLPFHACRRGFMFRDLIATVVILLLAIGIMLPGCSGSRDSGSSSPLVSGQPSANGAKASPKPGIRNAEARAKTMENLRQLVAAVHSANDTYKRFPPAYAAAETRPKFGKGPGTPPDSKTPYTLYVHLLPFVGIDEVELFSSGPGQFPTATVPLYVAPLDPSPAEKPANIVNYLANVRIFSNCYSRSKFDYKDGIALVQSAERVGEGQNTCHINLSNLRDGTANTMMFATGYAICGTGKRTWFNPEGSSATGELLNPFFGAQELDFRNTANDEAGVTTGTNAKFGFQIAASAKTCSQMVPQALEKEGLFVGMADGAVRQVSPTIKRYLFDRAISPFDGNPTPSNWEK